MDRLLLPIASMRPLRRSRQRLGRLPQVGPLAIRASSSSSALETTADAHSHHVRGHHSSGRSARRVARQSDDDSLSRKSTVRLWSVLEEADRPVTLVVSEDSVAQSQTEERAPLSGSSVEPEVSGRSQQILDALRSASSIEVLDKRWRDLSGLMFESANLKDRSKELAARSLAISRLAKTNGDLSRVIGAMNRVVKNPTLPQGLEKEDYLAVINAAARAFLKAENGTRTLELVQELRRDQGRLFPNKRSYALAVASVLIPTSAPVASAIQKDVSAKSRFFEKGKESAFRTSLVYFKNLFAKLTRLEEESNTSLSFKGSANGEKDDSSQAGSTVFSVMAMMKEDFAAGNTEANLTQELFDDVLIMLPKMAAEVAEVMAGSGFRPTPTSFLAMLHSAMKTADAQKALQLLNAMQEHGVPREKFHYIATASALSSRAAIDKRRAHTTALIRPWYFKALLDGYANDFAADESIDEDFADAIVTGLCLCRAGDQDIVPLLSEVMKHLMSKNVSLQSKTFGMLLERLSVTKGKENVETITRWINQCNVQRDRYINEGFLKFYAEQVVKLQRGINRALVVGKHSHQDVNNPTYRTNAESKIKENHAVVAVAERIVQEMLNASKGFEAGSSAVLKSLSQHEKASLSLNISNVLPALPAHANTDQNPLEASSKAFEQLGRIYAYSFLSARLSQLIKDLRADVNSGALPLGTNEFLKPLLHLLIRAYGMEKQIDQAVEVVSQMQSEGIIVDSETVDLLVVDVMVRNDRLSEGLAHLLGLCRTYKIHPKSSTGQRLLEKARKERNEEEERRVMDMFAEFKMDPDLKRAQGIVAKE